MADEADGEKTEQPTEKKLSDARARGDLPVSREATLFAGLLASLAVTSFLVRDGAIHLAEVLSRLLDDPGNWTLKNGADAALLAGIVLQAAAGFLVPVMIVFIVAGLAVSFAQNVPSFVLTRIAPDLSKISPMAGFKRLFSRSGLVEFAKSCFKLFAVGLVIALLLRGEQQTVVDAMFVEPVTVPDRILAILMRLLSGVAVAFAVLAAFDFVWSRMSYTRRMRMTRQEIKEEHKQAEGDPLFKAKRRSLAMDRARRRMLSNVHKATIVIANPTHFSIALRYVREEGGAPMVVAKGQDLLALKIRELAEENHIEIIENKPLARSMYDHVEVGQAIPPQFYKAVAEVIHFIQSRKAKKPPLEQNRVLH